jgi:hypothetical protein
MATPSAYVQSSVLFARVHMHLAYCLQETAIQKIRVEDRLIPRGLEEAFKT